MSTANNTIATRIQMKSDTQANWNNSNLIPFDGEIIIYSPDNDHSYSRLKVGDGTTSVTNLPFIDSGTLNGTEVEVVKKATFNDFPSPGSPDKLYIDLSTSRIYQYTNTHNYTQLSNFNYSVTKSNIRHITYWNSGSMTRANIDGHTLKIINGTTPELNYNEVAVVTNIQKEVVE